jgi:membrane protein DedA with SNARE-associated domain
VPDLLHWISTYGEIAIFILLFAGIFGLPVPDETLLTFAGVLVREGHVRFSTMWTAALLGSMCGITLSYVVGRAFGPGAVARFGRWFHVDRRDLNRVERWLEGSGRWSLTFGYFVPGVRHLTALVAGSSGLPPRIFALYAYSGAAAWTLIFISFGWIMGREWETALHSLHRHLAVLAILVLAGALLFVIHRNWYRR